MKARDLFAAAAVVYLVPGLAAAQNLLTNPTFESDLAGWVQEGGSHSDWVVEWDPEDVHAAVGSGSLRITDSLTHAHPTNRSMAQCLPAAPGATYDYGAWIRLPGGDNGDGFIVIQVLWFSGPDCQPEDFIDHVSAGVDEESGAWELRGGESVVAPPATQSSSFRIAQGKRDADRTFTALIDDASFCPSGTCTASGPPEPPWDSWIGSAELPGFEAQVRITPTAQPSLEGQEESSCIPETICAHGALAGRPEIFVKVIGPRPNGHLWVQLIRFTPSRVEVWLRQRSTFEVNYYVLDTVVLGVLPGLEDRTAFLP